MSAETVFKLVAWAIVVAVVLQVIFYFVFQTIGYDSYLLGVTLIVSVIIGFLSLVVWNAVKSRIHS